MRSNGSVKRGGAGSPSARSSARTTSARAGARVDGAAGGMQGSMSRLRRGGPGLSPRWAALVLARAEADAELALSLARENTARAEARAMLAQVEAMRQPSP